MSEEDDQAQEYLQALRRVFDLPKVREAFADMLEADLAMGEASRKFWDGMLNRPPQLVRDRIPATPGNLKPCAHAVRSIFKGESHE